MRSVPLRMPGGFSRDRMTFRPGLFLGLSLLAPLWAIASQEPAQPQAVFAHETSDLKPDPGVMFGRLENGVRYAILRNAQPQGRASLVLGVNAGSLEETDQQLGLAHFVEHMAFNGSEHFAPDTLVKYFQRLGMSFGRDANASTTFDRTMYLLELPDTREESLGKAFTLFADYGGGLLLKPASIEKERGIILAEERERDSQQQREWLAQMQFIAPQARFIRRLPIGTQKVITHAKRPQLVDYYDTWYRPENLVVVAVGDFDVVAVEKQIREAMALLIARAPARARPAPDSVEPPAKATAKFYSQPEAGTANVALDFVLPYDEHTDTAARRVKEIEAGMTLGMFNRRLRLKSREEGATLLGGEAQVGRSFGFLHLASLDVACRESAVWRECLTSAEHELRKALEQGFTQAELQEARAQVRNGLQQQEKLARGQVSSQLAQALLGSIADEKVFTTPAADRALYGPAVEAMTVEDCNARFRELFGSQTAPRLFVSGNLQVTDADVLAAYQASVAQPVAADEAKESPAFGYAVAGEPGKVKRQRAIEDLGVVVAEYENGVRLNLKRTDFEPGRIYIDMRIGAGLLTAPRDLPGLRELAENTFISGGLGKHSVEQIDSILAGRNVSYHFRVADDALKFGGATTPEDLLLQLQVMQAYVTDPGYRPEALRWFHDGLAPLYTALSHSIEGPERSAIPLLMAGGDARFGLPAREALEQRTLEELRAWLGPQLASGPIEITIVGALEVAKTLDAVGQTFGTLPVREAKPAYALERKVTRPQTPVAQHYTVDTDLKRGLVDMRWMVVDGLQRPVSSHIGLLSNVFADRLRIRLREEMGQTYHPDVVSELSFTFPGYGTVIATASVAPDQVKKVTAAIREVAQDLAEKGVTEDELRRAREPLLAAIHQGLGANGYWLEAVLSGAQEFPDLLERHREREARLKAVTVQDLDAAAKQYLAPSRAFEFSVLPKKQSPKK